MERVDGVGSALLTIVNAVDEELSPIVDLLPPGRNRHEDFRLRSCCGSFDVGEVPALGDGGTVGPVVGQHAVEDLTSLGEVLVLGDDVDAVLVTAAGGGDVQPSMGGGGRGEGDPHIDGVALVPVCPVAV